VGLPRLSTPQSRRSRLAWIGALAFASGFPFGFINELIPVWLRATGSGLTDVGLVAGATFPWTFKFLWAPLVDRFGTRRVWIVGCLLLLAAALLVLPLVPVGGHGALFWIVLVAIVTLSATQDIAIDAYLVETTTRQELGIANSVRIACYRVAMLVAGGALLWLAGWAGWPMAFKAGALMLAVLAFAAWRAPAPVRAPADASVVLLTPIKALLARPGIAAVFAFALLFKLDIAAMEPMTKPFWVDRGFTLAEIGTVLTTGRLLATVGGATLGGVLTTRWGIVRSLWVLGAVQACSSLGYAWAAFAAPSKGLILAAALFENFAAGLGTAAFVAYLMSVCERRFAATQYAMLSALLSATRALAGAASGPLAEQMGYGPYFGLTFAIGLPAFALIPLLARAAPPDIDDALNAT
jgi:PAT family beta-lactamase induction signal transducer AmpG